MLKSCKSICKGVWRSRVWILRKNSKKLFFPDCYGTAMCEKVCCQILVLFIYSLLCLLAIVIWHHSLYTACTEKSNIKDVWPLTIFQVAMPCKDMMIKCMWHGKEKDCCHLFKPIITSRGQCYVFNMLPGQLLYADYMYVYSVEWSWCTNNRYLNNILQLFQVM